MKITIKPLTVNQAWQGKRFKTPAYKAYEQELMYKLGQVEIPDPPLMAVYEFGVSSPLCDWDNPIKPMQDVLQKKYGFDDRDIHVAMVRKVLVPKGEEYVAFKFEHIAEDDMDSVDSVFTDFMQGE